LRKLTTATIPNGTWTEFGTSYSWNMVTGTCSTQSLSMTITTANETCLRSSDGTLTVTAYGGSSPLANSYSLDGVTYVSTNVFYNLPSGNGTVYVKDSSGTVISQSYNIGVGTSSTVYNLNISTTVTNNSVATYNKSKTVNWTATVSPPLPAGVSLSANIVINNYFTNYYYSTQNASFSSGSTASASGNASINTNTLTSTTGSGQRSCGGHFVPGYTNTGFTRTINVTFQGTGSSLDKVTGTDTFTVSHTTPIYSVCPVYGYNYYTVGVQNVTLTGSNCASANGSGGTNECVSTSPYPSGPGSGC